MTIGNGAQQPVNGWYRHYVLLLCCLCYFLAYVDRHVFSTLITPLKAEFGLSDATLGLLSGLAFGLTYSLMGLPMGALADRGSRKRILACCIIVWSAMTGLCGLAKSAAVLMIGRLGVGAGEAGVTPSSISVISDLYPPSSRARAIACYPIAGALGAAAALPIGAHLATDYGWRSVFLFLFFPGVLLAALIWFTFREPPRASDTEPVPHIDTLSFGQTLLYIVKQPHLMFLFAAGGLMSMMTSISHWLPAFYQRSHGVSLIDAGNSLGVVLAVTGPMGMFAGGWLSDKLGKGGTVLIMYMLAGITLLEITTAALMLLTPSFRFSLFWVFIWSLTTVAWAAPCFTLSQNLVPAKIKATSMAVLNVFNNIIGYGLGPVITGAISTGIGESAGGESLRWSLIVLGCGIGLLPTVMFLLAARAYAHRARVGEAHVA
jgi:predicted MFS family arabinose efflux permease